MISEIEKTVFVKIVAVCVVVIAQKTESPIDYEYEISEICEMLIKADEELVGKFQNRIKGEAETVMKQVREFNDNLTSITERHKLDWHRLVNNTILEAGTLIDHGGPHFINFYSDRKTLERDFGINNISSRVMECQRQNTIDIWEDFVKFYEIAAAGKDEDSSDIEEQ